MQFDVFFSISQTPIRGRLPDEGELWRAFFSQVRVADQLGFGCAWVAMSHLSTQVQKRHKAPVVPHWQGEIGLNNDIFQLAHRVFAQTRRIEVGAAVLNILCNGGPVARAEQVATFASLHGLDPAERRRLRVGFSAGRFDFMNRAYGVGPRDELEAAAWPALKGKVFAEACELFLRLLDDQVVQGADLRETWLSREDFRSEADWLRVQALAPGRPERIFVPRRYDIEPLRIIPRQWRRELVDLVVGSHDPALQVDLNRYLPVKVFNLSITRPEIIEQTHERMRAAYHPAGGPWRRAYMPRTVMVFLNEEPDLDADQRARAARAEANEALSAYWTALEGTIDPARVAQATDNAVVGNAEQVAAQLRERFHPDDRLMLWFDFFREDMGRVERDMVAFMERVAPLLT